jgi:hypothetical protein
VNAQSILEAQTEALLQRLVREQEQRCRKALEAAEEQAREIVARAYQDARTRVRQSATEERRVVDAALAAKRAELETAALKQRQVSMGRALETAWTALREALAARWEDARGRTQWTSAAAGCATRSFLGSDPVSVEVDQSLDADGAAAVLEILQKSGLSQIELERIGQVGPGLRIRSGAVCVDATLEGLLASRGRIAALLLAEIDRLQDAAEAPEG